MKKSECTNCVCLVAGENDEWVCEQKQQLIKKVDVCPEEVLTKEKDKLEYCKGYVVYEQYCIFDLFLENVGGMSNLKQELKSCGNKKEIRKMVNNYI